MTTPGRGILPMVNMFGQSLAPASGRVPPTIAVRAADVRAR
ncbi:hypothetical protein [Streptomyces sp. NPDC060027]